MSYVVLARKWRPQSFEDLIGQEHVSTTLANAIAQGRVAHAFLFTGVRGVGKTTSARILAKALSCEKGPTAKPCQECAACREITAGADVDVQEIDGASYNGVDEVRKLQESLPYRPQRDRFKIFIVDEVHMLSNAAWNAFLKTLEEPPPHVKFIFATTEVHKVPVTILSRCQRYDFKLISAQQIAARLRYVLEREKITADDAAVQIVAREAAGSMRDAMSLLDQVIAWVGVDSDKLTTEGVAKVLGVADRVILHKLAGALIDGDASECLRVVGDLAREGYDLPHVARDILAHLRDLVVAKVSDDPGKLLDLADAELADVKALAQKADADDLTRLHQGFSRAFDDIARSGQPRGALEMALVRLARRPPLLPVDEMMKRLMDLERRLLGGGGGGPGGAGPSGGAPRGGPPAPGGGARRPQGASTSAAEPAFAAPPAPQAISAPPAHAISAPPAQPISAPPAQAISAPPAQPISAPPAQAISAPPAHGFSAPAQAPSPPVARPAQPPVAIPPFRPDAAPTARPVFTAPPEGSAKPESVKRPDLPPQSAGPVSAPSPSFVAPSQPSPRSPSTPPPSLPVPSAPPQSSVKPPGPNEIAAFRAVIGLVRERRAPLASVLEHAVILRFDKDRVEIAYESSSFLMREVSEPAAKDILLGALRAHFGQNTELAIETIASKAGLVTIAMLETAERKARLDAAKRVVSEHPLVTAAIELLGAELRDIRLSEAEA